MAFDLACSGPIPGAPIYYITDGGLPNTWGSTQGRPVPARYGISPGVLDDSVSRQAIIEGLRSLPRLSIIAEPASLFSPETGLYAHPAERGGAWERPASIEWIGPGNRAGFSAQCGLRIHGGSSRLPQESPKHSFRLTFKPRAGQARLRFPLFGPGEPVEFDSLILRAGHNDSWLHPDGQARRRAVYLRDEWVRASFRAMGYPSVRGCFVHLYLNGLYWGVYNVCERPGPASLASLPPGPLPEFDSRKAGKIESGDTAAWDQLMDLASAGLGESSRYQAICRLLDVQEFADYLILNFYAGNSDWDRSANWYALRPRTPGGKFRFFVWDAECTLGDPEACTLDRDDDQSPLRLFQKLSENPQFRVLFGDRVRRLLLDDGPLAPGPARRRFSALAQGLEKAMAAESARWGDYRQTVDPYKSGPFETYTVKEHWAPEIQRLLSGYFDRRPGILLDQFRQRGLFQ